MVVFTYVLPENQHDPPKTAKTTKGIVYVVKEFPLQRDHPHVVQPIRVFQCSALQYRIQIPAIWLLNMFPPKHHINQPPFIIIYIISCKWCSLKPPKGQTLIMISFLNNKGHVSIINIPLLLTKVRWRESNIAATVGPEAIEGPLFVGRMSPLFQTAHEKVFFRLGVQTFQCKSHFISFHPPIVAVWFRGNWPNQPVRIVPPGLGLPKSFKQVVAGGPNYEGPKSS